MNSTPINFALPDLTLAAHAELDEFEQFKLGDAADQMLVTGVTFGDGRIRLVGHTTHHRWMPRSVTFIRLDDGWMQAPAAATLYDPDDIPGWVSALAATYQGIYDTSYRAVLQVLRAQSYTNNLTIEGEGQP